MILVEYGAGGKRPTINASSGMGNLAWVVTPESETHGSDTKTSQYTYDTRGRLLSESTSVNGGTVAILEYSYDDLGNLNWIEDD